jgi:hypothetical protein
MVFKSTLVSVAVWHGRKRQKELTVVPEVILNNLAVLITLNALNTPI